MRPSESADTPYRFTPKVAWLTVAAGSAIGLNLVFLHQAPHDCKLWPLVFARLSATVVVFALAAIEPEPATAAREAAEAGPGRGACWTSVANVTMLLALHTWLLSLASILISLYPAATVVLAMVVLRERVTRWQGIGMVMAMGSVAMIAALTRLMSRVTGLLSDHGRPSPHQARQIRRPVRPLRGLGRHRRAAGRAARVAAGRRRRPLPGLGRARPWCRT